VIHNSRIFILTTGSTATLLTPTSHDLSGAGAIIRRQQVPEMLLAGMLAYTVLYLPGLPASQAR
jgi:hypothetical protein